MLITLCLLAAPFITAHAAGGAITGVVTDPKGAVIVGATVTVTDPLSAQTFSATTDKDGRYKIEKLPEASYVMTVTAKGFADARRENVKVLEDKTTTLDLKLEIGAVEESVSVSASAAKGNTDSVYQQLRQNSVNPNA
ncbi:MAG: carboxypeptidase regulatory-like domain-containing protein, partial [Acidobacteria bacterium]|nr:carboxypeptidase regulatory-like domain-containing protein [Acidobacteriota bacterium]